LRELDLSNTHITYADCRYIADFLRYDRLLSTYSIVLTLPRHNSSLWVLQTGSNRIGDEGAEMLASALVRFGISVTQNSLTRTNQAVNRSLEELRLSNCGISSKGALSLIKSLEVRFRFVSSQRYMRHLSQNNSALRLLSLSANPIVLNAVLLDPLRRASNLQALHLQHILSVDGICYSNGINNPLQ
jgi:hypothetical protein